MTAADDEQELKAIVSGLMPAVEREGAALLNRYIADDFVMTYCLNQPMHYGRFLTKAQVVDMWSNSKMGDKKVDDAQATIDIQRVHISGDIGIVFAHVTDKFRDETGEQVVQTWVSDVWTKRDGDWRWLASHETHLRPE